MKMCIFEHSALLILQTIKTLPTSKMLESVLQTLIKYNL